MADHARLEFESVRLSRLAENDELVAEYGIHDVFDVLVKFRFRASAHWSIPQCAGAIAARLLDRFQLKRASR